MKTKLITSGIAVSAALLLAGCETIEPSAQVSQDPPSITETDEAPEADEAGTKTAVSLGADDENAANENEINGHSVSAVTFANGGRIAVSGKNQWTEYDAKTGQPAFVFEETARDDWSVYLKQIDDPKRLQVDIFRMKLGYTGGTSPMSDLYNIESGSLTAPTVLSKYVYEGVNGANLAMVSVGENKASFTQTSDKVWTEYNQEGEAFNTFAETGRDEWSVYLNDEGRNIRIQLDVHRDMILLGQDGGEMADQWPMTGAAKQRDNLTDAAG